MVGNANDHQGKNNGQKFLKCIEFEQILTAHYHVLLTNIKVLDHFVSNRM